jgi:hypothetical protein
VKHELGLNGTQVRRIHLMFADFILDFSELQKIGIVLMFKGNFVL